MGICARIGADCRMSSDTFSFECSSWQGFHQGWEAARRPILLELCFSWYLIWRNKTWLVRMCTGTVVCPFSCSSGLAMSHAAVSGLALVTQRLKRKWHLWGESLFCLFSIEVLVSLYDCRSLSCKNCTVGFREELEPFFGTWHLLCGCEVSSSQPFVSSHQTESGHEVVPEGH